MRWNSESERHWLDQAGRRRDSASYRRNLLRWPRDRGDAAAEQRVDLARPPGGRWRERQDFKLVRPANRRAGNTNAEILKLRTATAAAEKANRWFDDEYAFVFENKAIGG